MKLAAKKIKKCGKKYHSPFLKHHKTPPKKMKKTTHFHRQHLPNLEIKNKQFLSKAAKQGETRHWTK